MTLENDKQTWKNPWVIIILITIIVLGAIVSLSILRDKFVNSQQWTINFSGQGKVSYEPDIANISMGVKIDKKEKAQEALSELNTTMKNVIDALKQSGIPIDDIHTQDYLLSPQYDYINEKSVLSGYTATQNTMIKIRAINTETESISKTIEMASEAGVNVINGITFESSDIDRLKQEARLLAINDARSKASDNANALNVKLGNVVSWWENYSPVPTPYYADYAYGVGGGGVAPIIPTGNNEIIIEVNITYRIK